MFLFRRGIFFIFFWLLFLSPFVSEAADLAFRIDQSKVKLVIPAGGSRAGDIKVYSQSKEPVKLKVYVQDWRYTLEQDGSKEFLPAGSTKFSSAPWIKFSPAELNIPPYGIGKVNYVVNVPQDAAGAHFAVMFFETGSMPASELAAPGEQQVASGVGLSIRLGSLIYVEAKDSVKRSVELTNFSVGNDDNNYIVIKSDLKNTGNTYISTEGTYHITDKEGGIFARGQFNETFTFPGDSSQLSTTWKEKIPAGSYDLVLTLDLGKAQEEGGLSRGPVMLKEAELEIGADNQVIRTGELK